MMEKTCQGQYQFKTSDFLTSGIVIFPLYKEYPNFQVIWLTSPEEIRMSYYSDFFCQDVFFKLILENPVMTALQAPWKFLFLTSKFWSRCFSSIHGWKLCHCCIINHFMIFIPDTFILQHSNYEVLNKRYKNANNFTI
jgi:hypothetical protein